MQKRQNYEEVSKMLKTNVNKFIGYSKSHDKGEI